MGQSHTQSCSQRAQLASSLWVQFPVCPSLMVLVPTILRVPFPSPDQEQMEVYAGDAHFQYINVPAPGNFEWGYRRGNPDHNREEYLSQKDHTFKAKLKWHDGYGGHGEHYYDINHVGPKEHAAPAYHAPKPAYGAGSENVASYVPAPAAPSEAMIFNISLLSRLVFLFASSPITMLQLCVIL